MQRADSEGHLQRTRVRTVDIAKGIGIILVVIGHYSVPSAEPQYWVDLRHLIYTFHMPLFMILSGYLYGFAGRPVVSFGGYWVLVKAKIFRLVLPYITITMVYLLAKGAAGAFFKLQHPLDSTSARYVLVNPVNGFASDLWFIYTLFVIFLVFPLLELLAKKDVLIVAAAVGLAVLVQWPTEFCLSLAFYHLPFFALGYAAARHVRLDGIRRSSAALALLFSLALFSAGYAGRVQVVNSGAVSSLLGPLLAATGASICVLVASLISRLPVVSRTMSVVGSYTTIIYLTHTIAASGLRIGFFEVLRVGPSLFWLTAITAVSAGVLAPMVFQRWFIRPGSAVARYALGDARHAADRPAASTNVAMTARR